MSQTFSISGDHLGSPIFSVEPKPQMMSLLTYGIVVRLDKRLFNIIGPNKYGVPSSYPVSIGTR